MITRARGGRYFRLEAVMHFTHHSLPQPQKEGREKCTPFLFPSLFMGEGFGLLCIAP